MTFVLGTETIVSINDGGMGIHYDQVREFQPEGVRPVLSLEVYTSILESN
jgi:hypothetical protein